MTTGWDNLDTSTRNSTNNSPANPQSPATYNAHQWMNHFASQEQASWQHQGPPPSAPAPNNVPVSSYNPNTYGLMPGAHQPPRSGWSANSSPGLPPDTRVWGVHYNRQHDHGSEQDLGPKPPLPVTRPYKPCVRPRLLIIFIVAKTKWLLWEPPSLTATLRFLQHFL